MVNKTPAFAGDYTQRDGIGIMGETGEQVEIMVFANGAVTFGDDGRVRFYAHGGATRRKRSLKYDDAVAVAKRFLNRQDAKIAKSRVFIY